MPKQVKVTTKRVKISVQDLSYKRVKNIAHTWVKGSRVTKSKNLVVISYSTEVTPEQTVRLVDRLTNKFGATVVVETV